MSLNQAATQASISRFPRRDAKQWRLIIQRYIKSTLSITDFCQQESIGKVSFHKWHNRYKNSSEQVKSVPSNGFIEITETQPSIKPTKVDNQRPWDIELDLGDGVVCRFRRG